MQTLPGLAPAALAATVQETLVATADAAVQEAIQKAMPQLARPSREVVLPVGVRRVKKIRPGIGGDASFVDRGDLSEDGASFIQGGGGTTDAPQAQRSRSRPGRAVSRKRVNTTGGTVVGAVDERSASMQQAGTGTASQPNTSGQSMIAVHVAVNSGQGGQQPDITYVDHNLSA